MTGPVVCDVCKTRKVEPRAQQASQIQHATPTQPRSQHQRNTSTMTKAIQNGGFAPGRNLAANSQLSLAEEEGFMDVLKTVASALPTGLSIIGGGSIGALAGFTLNAASQMTAESANVESAMDGPAAQEGFMERAILAEAT